MKKIILIITIYLSFLGGMQSQINQHFEDDDCVCVFSDQCKDFGDNQPQLDLRQLNDINYIKPCENILHICCYREHLINSKITETRPDRIGSNPQPRECGISNPHGIGFALRNLNDGTQYAEFPWMIEILIDNGISSEPIFYYLAGGSLIHPLFVLTAAHKVYNKNPRKLKVRAGEWDRNSEDEPYEHQDRNIIRTIVHPAFDNATLYNSVALLFLEYPMEIDNQVNTICLPVWNSYFDNRRCIVTGWGQDAVQKREILNTLKKVEVPIKTYYDCEQLLQKTRLGPRFKLHSSFICAGGEAGEDACFGDGGSPMVCQDYELENKYYQIGIVAGGVGCGENNVPGIYIEVRPFANWIQSQMDNVLSMYRIV